MVGRGKVQKESAEKVEKLSRESSDQKPEEKKMIDLLNFKLKDSRKAIFNYFSYEELSKLRQVCKLFNLEISVILTQGYKDFSKELDRERADLKRALPRREAHQLYSYSETISSLETRRDLLEMTFRRYIDKNQACFIPGKVLDEGFRLLRHLRSLRGTTRTFSFELLKDFRDLSSMAIEHFDEHIAPPLRLKQNEKTLSLFMRPIRPMGRYCNIGDLDEDDIPNAVSTMSATALNQKLTEQQEIIKKQNIKIDSLVSAMSSFINKIHMGEVNFTEILQLLPVKSDAEVIQVSDEESYDKPCCSKNIPKKKQHTTAKDAASTSVVTPKPRTNLKRKTANTDLFIDTFVKKKLLKK